ncbi:integrase [Sulfolobales Mexican fusellovirus 1]|uniref:integrase n=1 Tax=Sulfolobales Mexican fusellovirus 1 TaxID=1298531 RepID=UPI0002C133DB|nr:integrase [Sulfolobales Mexican fusellovirus 1]AGG36556.1 integrase [Sulfolobales Mexican fusellovirus 1]
MADKPRTVTLGEFRLRYLKNKVYVYKVKNGYEEEYIAPLERLVEHFLSTADAKGQDRKDGKGQIDVLQSAPENVGETKVNRNEVTVSSVIELQRFFNWCVKFASEQTCNTYVKYLQRPPNSTHPSIRAWRAYYKWKGKEDKLKELKLPRSGSDLRLVTEDEVKRALKNSSGDEVAHYILSLLVESGLRLSEVVKVLNEYEPSQDTAYNTFNVYNVNWRRGRKNTLYMFHISPLRQMTLDYENTRVKLARYIDAKFMRKFVATKMFELEIPAEVIDFIQGRAPTTVATKHYIYLFTIARKYYEEKWVPYVRALLNLNSQGESKT